MRLFTILLLALGACGDADKDDWTVGKGDCDDASAAVNPDADEICDGIDNDCDGVIDDDALDPATWYADVDGDGSGDSEDTSLGCAAPDGYVGDGQDCDDANPDAHPDAVEACNGWDDDCDGITDESGATGERSWWKDVDGDGFGDPDSTPVVDCDDPGGRAANDDDCDDDDDAIHPDAQEVCDPDDVDEDCDGRSDDADDTVDPATTQTWFADADRDGYGAATDAGTDACDRPEDTVADATDCEDADADVHPGADEVCDGVDSDCDPTTLEAGRVYFEGTDGARTDLTAKWAAGTSSKPATVDLDTDGAVSVCDGTWYVRIDVTAPNLTIEGPNGAELAVLDGGGAGTIVELVDGSAVTLRGLTLQNGDGDTNIFGFGTEGGAVACSGGSTLSAESVVFQENYGYIGGAILAMDGCTVDLVDSVFEGNTASYGAALLGYDDVSITATGTDFLDGAATATGGGMYLQATDEATPVTADFDDCYFSGNTAPYGAGLGIFAWTDVTCTGAAGSEAGFHANTSTLTAAVYTTEATGSFTATSCDFGEAETADDNSADVMDLNDETHAYGDDATFVCDADGCG